MNLFSKKVHKVEIYGYSYGCKNLEKMCVFVIGDVHEILVELEGMGGGGKVQLEVCFFY